ncbi:GntR family transcriptional regulator [Acuticoccus sediminis]|uniref:GntR family transcriptional regulator n=1 Tax=Acuticoccus sediminis TaxID=2184697 RepID=UPI001CFEFC95|nr:GntR family transcriptional regulator [Acuticoccus sediminis]
MIVAQEESRTASRHSALAEVLRQEIEGGTWAVGEKFPTEADLQSRFGVGRYTIRKALKILTEQGLIARRPKTGSVVLSDTPVTQFVHTLRDLREVTNFGRVTRFSVQQQGIVTVDADSAPDPADAGRYFRVAGPRYLFGASEPLCWSEILVPEDFQELREQMRAGHSPVYELALERYGLKLDYIAQTVAAIALSPAMARLLKAEGETAALLVTRRFVETGGRAFELTRHLYPSGRYVLATVYRER